MEAEEFHRGVSMVPKPKSEAWILCALRDGYQQCEKLEQALLGSDRSSNSLKKQLKEFLGEPANRTHLLEKMENGQLEMARVTMPSMEAFKERCRQVMDSLGI
ncbi:hypothetical protein [Desulfogranum mediterraneum]|uniref:hypothetical protein n=1 Tax=Desulfogranum mediterraneum TaxID=160661 RepID=UPI00129485FA|nr:hypothetical protein [Desulfogranum mediterraneum]